MQLYQFLSAKLRKFTLVEFVMVKWVYVFFGLLLASLVAPLLGVSWCFWLAACVIAGLPLLVYVLSFSGNLFEKARQYIANNNPSNQVLTAFSCIFFALAATAFYPALARFDWWVYVGIMVVLIAKPFTHVFLRK